MHGAGDLSDNELCTNTYVRLGGISTKELNGAIATIISYDGQRNRFGVSLHSGGLKAIKAENLGKYEFNELDRCCRCGSEVNLFAIPACECESHTDDDDDDDDSQNDCGV